MSGFLIKMPPRSEILLILKWLLFRLQWLFHVPGWHYEKQFIPLRFWHLIYYMNCTMCSRKATMWRFLKIFMLALSRARVRWLQLDFWIESKHIHTDLCHGSLISKCVGDCYKMWVPDFISISWVLFQARPKVSSVCVLKPNTQVPGWILGCQIVLHIRCFQWPAWRFFSEGRYWGGLTCRRGSAMNTSNMTMIHR